MFLIHQMGKVGSTAIKNSVESAGIPCLQTHTIGRQRLHDMLDSFLDPYSDLERIRHEQHLFREQIIATRLVEAARGDPERPLKMITLSRDPVDRWFSAILQNYQAHLRSARRYCYWETGNEPKEDLQSFRVAFKRVLNIIMKLPSFDKTTELRKYLEKEKFAADPAVDFDLRQIGGELLVPFFWFEHELAEPFNITLADLVPESGTKRVQRGSFEVLFIKFEVLRDHPSMVNRVLSEFVHSQVHLQKANVSRDKEGFKTIQALRRDFESAFRQCGFLRESEYCKALGYLEKI